MLEENNVSDPLELTAEEQAYFDNGGEVPSGEPAGGSAEPERPVLEAEAGGNEPDGEEEDDDSSSEQGKRPGFVPHRKLNKEIERRKAREAELAKEREDRIRLEERFNQFVQRFQQPQQQQPTEQEVAPPKAEEDLFGAVDYTGKKVETLDQRLARFEKAEEERQQAQRLQQATIAAERAFMAENPDLPDAVAHLRQTRIAELQIFGWTEEQALQKVYQEEQALAAHALQRGQNPAEIAYRWAERRGYSKKQPEIQPAEQPAAERLARQVDAKARSGTLSNGGGAPAPVQLDARTVAAMSEDEFAALMAKSPKALEKLMMG